MAVFNASVASPMRRYEQVETFLREYFAFAIAILRRAYFSMLVRSWSTPASQRRLKLIVAVKTSLVNPSTSKYREEMSRLKDLVPASKREDPLFMILTSDHPIHELSLALGERFSKTDFEELAEIHEWKIKHAFRHQLKLKEVFGFLFGLGALLLSTIPESVVVKFFDYNEYQLVIFWIVVGVVGYLAILLVPAWAAELRERQKINFVGDVISYAAILQRKQSRST